jgi:hypothetical protein
MAVRDRATHRWLQVRDNPNNGVQGGWFVNVLWVSGA